MKEKKVDYGTTYQVEIESADSKCIICIAPSIKEGFVLLYHGLKTLPTKGDKGKIVFERNNSKFKGHWQYYPNIKITTMPINNKTVISKEDCKVINPE